MYIVHTYEGVTLEYLASRRMFWSIEQLRIQLYKLISNLLKQKNIHQDYILMVSHSFIHIY